MFKIKSKIWLMGTVVCAVLFSGCGAKENNNKESLKNNSIEKSQKNVKTASKESVRQKKAGGVPFLVVDEDYNVIGNRHFEEMEAINLSIDGIGIHLGIAYESPQEREKKPNVLDNGFQIGKGAFDGCSRLKQITIFSDCNVKYVAEDAWKDCPKDLTVYCKKGTYVWKRLQELDIHVEDITPIEKLEDGKEISKKYPDYCQDYEDYFLLDTDNTLVGYTDYHFDYENESTVVHLPEETKQIGKLAFTHSYGMGEIVIPEQIEEIEDMAFAASPVKKFTFQGNNLKKIGALAFTNIGTEIEKIELPEGVETIGNQALTNGSIKEIIIPKTVRTVGRDFFEFDTKKLVIKGKNTEFMKWTSDYLMQQQSLEKKYRGEVYCYKGSKAEKFFKKLGCKIRYLK